MSAPIGYGGAEELQREVERLRELIRTAPHAEHCEAASGVPWPGPCTCWKAKV